MQQSDTQLIPLEAIEHRIHVVRGLKVMLDKDLAELYQVPTKRLNEQVKRNGNRFPLDFMFQLSEEEAAALRSHSATSKTGRGGRRYLPYAFTEHGALMLASVLTSTIAVEVSIQIVRAFVRLRELITSHKDLARKLEALEHEYDVTKGASGKLYILDGGFVNSSGIQDTSVGTQVNPVPTMTGISPLTATVGSGAVTLTLTGRDFIDSRQCTGMGLHFRLRW